MSARAAARHLEVSASTGVKWAQQWRSTGRLSAKPMGGVSRLFWQANETGFWRGWSANAIRRLLLWWQRCARSVALRSAATRCGGSSSAAASPSKKDTLRQGAGPARRRPASRPLVPAPDKSCRGRQGWDKAGDFRRVPFYSTCGESSSLPEDMGTPFEPLAARAKIPRLASTALRARSLSLLPA